MAFIIDDILLSPVSLVKWIGEKFYLTAERELTDESPIQEQLLKLQLRYELDEITTEEYRDGEDRLMARLEAIREYKEKREAGKK